MGTVRRGPNDCNGKTYNRSEGAEDRGLVASLYRARRDSDASCVGVWRPIHIGAIDE
jgi:hypothetical protein